MTKDEYMKHINSYWVDIDSIKLEYKQHVDKLAISRDQSISDINIKLKEIERQYIEDNRIYQDGEIVLCTVNIDNGCTKLATAIVTGAVIDGSQDIRYILYWCNIAGQISDEKVRDKDIEQGIGTEYIRKLPISKFHME